MAGVIFLGVLSAGFRLAVGGLATLFYADRLELIDLTGRLEQLRAETATPGGDR